MTDELGRRWDDAVELAWTHYRRALADRLATLPDGEHLVLGVAEGAPYCRVTRHVGDRLRVEAASSSFLTPARELDDAARAHLAGLGLTAPGDDSPSFWVDLEHRAADRAAWIVVAALRDAYGVLHPLCLDDAAPAPREDGPAEPDDVGVEAPDADFPPAGDEEGPWSCRDEAQVRGAVHRVARRIVAGEPEWDEDGDLGLRSDRGVLYVVVARRVPRILLSATLLTDVADEPAALVEVNLLNRRHFGLTFLLDEGRVVVRRELSVSAFDPADVTREIERVLDHLDGWISELRARVGGRGITEDRVARPQREGLASPQEAASDDEHERYLAAYRVMAELESADGEALDPATLVRVFHADRSLLMSGIAHARRREAFWRARGTEYDADGNHRSVRMARARARLHRERRGRLRRALRLVVAASRRHDAAEQLALFPQDDVTS